jgi:toxin FitB
MRYVVLDTDVASRAIKGQLGDPMAARLTGAAWCVTFVTVGELWQWATTRSWGPRTREQLEQWLGRVVVLHSDDATSRAWGRISAAARRRGRPRPANDSWIAACCLAHQFALATFNVKDSRIPPRTMDCSWSCRHGSAGRLPPSLQAAR